MVWLFKLPWEFVVKGQYLHVKVISPIACLELKWSFKLCLLKHSFPQISQNFFWWFWSLCLWQDTLKLKPLPHKSHKIFFSPNSGWQLSMWTLRFDQSLVLKSHLCGQSLSIPSVCSLSMCRFKLSEQAHSTLHRSQNTFSFFTFLSSSISKEG